MVHREEAPISRNPDRPASLIDLQTNDDQKNNTKKIKRISSPEKWEYKQVYYYFLLFWFYYILRGCFKE